MTILCIFMLMFVVYDTMDGFENLINDFNVFNIVSSLNDLAWLFSVLNLSVAFVAGIDYYIINFDIMDVIAMLSISLFVFNLVFYYVTYCTTEIIEAKYLLQSNFNGLLLSTLFTIYIYGGL